MPPFAIERRYENNASPVQDEQRGELDCGVCEEPSVPAEQANPCACDSDDYAVAATCWDYVASGALGWCGVFCFGWTWRPSENSSHTLDAW
jgi:hypothetical protein